MLNRYFLPLLCLLLGSCVCAESPQQAEDARLAKQCRTLLEKTLVDWYLPNCVDVQHGGYFERTNESGKFIDGEKFLTLQARHVWFFSRLAVADIRKDESLAAAEAGYQFLRNHFYDSKHGGYFTRANQFFTLRRNCRGSLRRSNALYT